MPIESINTDVLFVVIGALPILLTIVYLDRYLARRRGFASNAAYVSRIQAARGNSALHQFGRSYRVNRQFEGSRFDDLSREPHIELSANGFFSRRRIITDRFGRVVATHYEEYVMSDRFHGIGVSGIPMPGRQLLMLASGKA
ncbi:MAG: hypothetical protein ND866_27675 [Pyrinomonadaceae bacterium]|nr:hypothetical protein [Pyrinomonadaceae bacterium]